MEERVVDVLGVLDDVQVVGSLVDHLGSTAVEDGLGPKSPSDEDDDLGHAVKL